jgi:hypothetical protein
VARRHTPCGLWRPGVSCHANERDQTHLAGDEGRARVRVHARARADHPRPRSRRTAPQSHAHPGHARPTQLPPAPVACFADARFPPRQRLCTNAPLNSWEKNNQADFASFFLIPGRARPKVAKFASFPQENTHSSIRGWERSSRKPRRQQALSDGGSVCECVRRIPRAACGAPVPAALKCAGAVHAGKSRR